MLLLRVSDVCGLLRVATALTVAGAGLGVALVGSAGTAFADTGVIGVSPGREVVQFAPNAVSVTFDTPLRATGASMSIRTKNGEVGQGKVSTTAATLRRAVELGAPNGPYTIDWKAVAQDGRKLSGSFSFTAGHPNDDPLITGEPAPAAPPASPPSAWPTPLPTASRPVKDPWANDGDAGLIGVPDEDEGSGGSGASYGFPLLALGVGSVLVIASALVSRRHRPAVAERLTIRTSRGVYSV